MPGVVVAIPTFRRPKGLERLLGALAGLDTRAQVCVLVADNDAERREGAAVVAALKAQPWRWPLEAILVPERGIAQARNALVARALAHGQANYVAMLDDDEWPGPGWLEAFLDVARTTGADALHGAVLPRFEVAPGRWAEPCPGLSPLRGITGPVAMIHGTSNVLIRRAALERLAAPFFDPRFALSGGEDKDFFTRLAKAGTRFAWADEAVVHAHVPVTRSNPAWALRRAFRIGNSDMRVFIKHERGFAARAREAAKIAGAMCLSPALAVLLAPLPARRMMPLCKFARASGKLAAAFGARYDEYAVTHGQ
ncbi:MAG TPA: glycosyltransferase [Rhizomicrobium sp.]|jgi:GT2 family glycosyltransferase|nr:glycosyltransferase [Rhizomicrobium sp.]